MAHNSDENHGLKWWLTLIYVVLGAILGLLGGPVTTALNSML